MVDGDSLDHRQNGMAVGKEGGSKRKRLRLSTIKTILDPGLSTHPRADNNDGGENPGRKKQKTRPFDHANEELRRVGNKQSSQSGLIASGRKTGKKKKKKKKKKKSPCQRVICIAESTLIQCIDRKEGKDLSDISKDLINTLPDVPYKKTKNPVVVVSDAKSSDKAVAEIRAELAGKDNAQNSYRFRFLGFDTETRPKFHKGGDTPPPSLIQLATKSTAYLFRLTFQGMNKTTGTVMTESLQKLLGDRSIIKVGVGIQKDVEDLKRAYGTHCCGDGTSYLDLGHIAKLRWPKVKRAGLRNLTATVLRQKLSKAQQMKNWEMERLTPAMEGYAAADAWVSLDLLDAIVDDPGCMYD